VSADKLPIKMRHSVIPRMVGVSTTVSSGMAVSVMGKNTPMESPKLSLGISSQSCLIWMKEP
jgi:hypothetical protein